MALVAIPEEDDGPATVFSVGLYHSFDQPEIMIVGLDTAIGGQLVNTVGKRMLAGTVSSLQDTGDDIADRMPVCFRDIAKAYYRSYLGYALWFYESFGFSVLQYLWPDKSLRLPWGTDCDDSCRLPCRRSCLKGK